MRKLTQMFKIHGRFFTQTRITQQYQTIIQVWPLNDSTIRPLNENCKKLIESHRNGFPGERNLHQVKHLKKKYKFSTQ